MLRITDIYSGNKFVASEEVKKYAGVIFKAGQGIIPNVPKIYPEWEQEAKNVGMLVGWYWLVDSRVKATRQVEACLSTLKDFGSLKLWADIEMPYGGMTPSDYWATLYAGFDNYYNFIELIRQKTGIRIGIYSSPYMWKTCIGNARTEVHEWFAQSELWTANYPWIFVPGTSKPTLYGAWKNWVLWQYRAEPDESIFNGSDVEFYEYFGESAPVPEPEPPTPGLPEPIPAGHFPIVVEGVTYTNKDPINWEE